MDNQNNEDLSLYFVRSNHFVSEYLNTKNIQQELKNNPRFQSIIWHISVMLKRENINFGTEKSKKWMDDNISIGKNGEIGYVLAGKDRYYAKNSSSALQFIKYSYENDNFCRNVKELDANNNVSLEILSIFNSDGIEEKQFVTDYTNQYSCTIERVQNRPELIKMSGIDPSSRETSVIYQKRLFWVALEDLHPNMIEIDPLNTNPLLQFGGTQLYEDFSIEDINITKINFNKILPLSQKNREEILNYYKSLNENYKRTKVFERGLAKMLTVKNKEPSK